jgi:hypothetical protein
MREAPSGSGTITDEVNALVTIADNQNPGVYLAAFLANVESQLAPANTPAEQATAVAAGIFNGVQTRAGRIGRCRILFGADPNGSPPGVRKDTILQWVIIDQTTGKFVAVGKEVVVPWQQFVDTTTPDITQFGNQGVDFGSVPWKAGQMYALMVTVGTVVSGTPGNAVMTLTFERIYVPLAPVIGPSEGP